MMTPKLVWLLLIPVFNMVWQFIVVSRVTISLENEFLRRNIVKESNPGKKIGLAWCIFNLCSYLFIMIILVYDMINIIYKVYLMPNVIISIMGIITSIAGLVCLIVYWRKIARYSAEIALPYRIA
jgi:hypothetical protein